MPAETHVDVAIVGAGIATAYYLCVHHSARSVLLIDSRQAMSFTSAQSGDNYRNWWPHPTMAEFTNRSIDLMEALADESSNIFRICRSRRWPSEQVVRGLNQLPVTSCYVIEERKLPRFYRCLPKEY